MHIDKSERRKVMIRRRSGVIEHTRLCDIPIKVYYANGQVADVGKASEFLAKQSDPLTSTILEVPALCINASHPIVIFGNGIDIDDIYVPYQFLLNIKKEELRVLEEARLLKQKQKISLPKISIPGIQLRSPITFNRETTDNSEKKDEQ